MTGTEERNFFKRLTFFGLASSCLLSQLLVLSVPAACADDRSVALYRAALKNMDKKKTFGLALEQFNTLLKVDPDNAKFNEGKASVLYKLDECEEALIYINRALALDKTNAECWHTKAKILHFLNRDKEALAACDKADQVLGKKSDEVIRADALFGCGRLQEAEKELDRLLTANPSRVSARSRRADIYAATKQWQKEIDERGRLLLLIDNLYQKNIQLYRRAEAYIKIKQYKKAIEDYQAALKVTPEARDLHAGLLNAYTLTGDKRAQAEKKYLDSLDDDYKMTK